MNLKKLIKKYEHKAVALENVVKAQNLVLWKNMQQAEIWRKVVEDLKDCHVDCELGMIERLPLRLVQTINQIEGDSNRPQKN